MDNPLFRFDPGIFLWTFIAFGFLSILLGKFAFAPILQALQDREIFIQSALDNAKDIHQKHQSVERDVLSILQKAEQTSAKIIDEATKKAKQIAAEIETQARVKAQTFLNAVDADIQRQKDLFLQQMSLQVSTLSLDISKKIISNQLFDQKRANEFLLQSLSLDL